MKRILIILAALWSFAQAQTPPANYTDINQRYQWLAGAFKAFNMPAYGDTAFTAGQWRKAGAMLVDTTGSNKGVYVYYDGYWHLIGGTAAANLYNTDGTLTGNRLLSGNSFSLDMDSLAALSITSRVVSGQSGVLQLNHANFNVFMNDVGTTDLTAIQMSGQEAMMRWTDGAIDHIIRVDGNGIGLTADQSATPSDSAYTRDASGTLIYSPINGGGNADLFGNGITKTGDSVKLGGQLTDTTTYTQIAVNARTSQFATGNYTVQDVTSNQPMSDTVNFPHPGSWNYWRQRGGNQLKMYERHFYEDRGDTASVQYNSIVQSKNVIHLDPNSHRYRTRDGWKNLAGQDAGFSAGNSYYTYDTINMRPSPFGVNGNVFYGTKGFGQDSAYTINLLRHPTAPVPTTNFASLISTNDFVPTNLKRVIQGGDGLTGYAAWWKSGQGEVVSPSDNTGNYVSKIADYTSVGGMYINPFGGLSTKADILEESTVDTAISFNSWPQWTATNEVKNGYSFVNQGQYDINVFHGLTQMGYGTTWKQKSDLDAFVNRRLDVGGSVYIRDTLTLGADPDAVFQFRSAGKAAFGVKSSTLAKVYMAYYDTIAATTPTTINRVLHVDRDITLADATTMGTSSGLNPLLIQGFYRPDATSSFSTNYQGSVLGLVSSFGFRDKGAVATQAITAGSTFNTGISGFMSKFATEGSGTKNITGVIGNIRPVLEHATAGTITAYSDFVSGSWSGTIGGTITTRYGHYLLPIKQTGVTNAYALYQEGTADSNYFAGITRHPNLVASDTATAKPVGITANGTLVKLPNWGSVGGRYSYHYDNEFINPVTASNDGNGLIATNSGGTSSSAAIDAANHPGAIAMATGTGTTGKAMINTALTSFAGGAGTMTFEQDMVNPATASDGTDSYIIIAGFYDTGSANQTDGVYFLYDSQGTSTGSAASGNWQIVTASNSNRTFTTTSTAVTTSAYIALRIELNAAGTLATFYVNGSSVGTSSTNIPTGTSRVFGFGSMILKSAGTNARSFNIDYMEVNSLFTSARY